VQCYAFQMAGPVFHFQSHSLVTSTLLHTENPMYFGLCLTRPPIL
jgi:hypothetical protein